MGQSPILILQGLNCDCRVRPNADIKQVPVILINTELCLLSRRLIFRSRIYKGLLGIFERKVPIVKSEPMVKGASLPSPSLSIFFSRKGWGKGGALEEPQQNS